MKPVLEPSNNTNLLVVRLPCIFMLKKLAAASSGYLAHRYTEYCRAGILFLFSRAGKTVQKSAAFWIRITEKTRDFFCHLR